MDKLEDYQIRMLEEYKELSKKIDKLHKFIWSDSLAELELEKIDLLTLQEEAMLHYLSILEKRLILEGIQDPRHYLDKE